MMSVRNLLSFVKRGTTILSPVITNPSMSVKTFSNSGIPLRIYSNNVTSVTGKLRVPKCGIVAGGPLMCQPSRLFHSFLKVDRPLLSGLVLPVQNLNCQQLQLEQRRTVTKCSMMKGRRKSVKTVLYRFYRLHWGAWIHPLWARNKKLFRRDPYQKVLSRQHIFCSSRNSRLFDQMVSDCWKRKKYYVDDIYEPYQTREEFDATARPQYPYRPGQQNHVDL